MTLSEPKLSELFAEKHMMEEFKWALQDRDRQSPIYIVDAIMPKAQFVEHFANIAEQKNYKVTIITSEQNLY